MAQEKKPAPVHADHRSRMRARVAEYGLDSLAEHEALEYILYYTIPRQDTNPIAHALIRRFGSFAGVWEASEEELMTVPGIGRASASFLHMLQEADKYYLLCRSKQKRRLSDGAALAEYLIPLFRGAKRERLAMLALDDRRRLLRTIWLDSGSAGVVDVSMRKVAGEAVAAGAAYVVLAHNHPDGVALPSREDLMSTHEITRALALLEVQVLDHIILAGDDWLSMRESGRMDLPGILR